MKNIISFNNTSEINSGVSYSSPGLIYCDSKKYDKHFGVVYADYGDNASFILTVDSSENIIPQKIKKRYTVSLSAGQGGSVSGGGVYEEGTVITITATPSTDYNFEKWSDGNTNASRQLTVNNNISLSASFITIPYYTVTLITGTGGSVSGGGSYRSGTIVTITATPDSKHNFTSWSDGSTASTRQITVSNNITLTASFAAKRYTLTLNAGTGGNVNGGGTYDVDTVVTITATPDTGYNFTKWSDNNTNASRQITVTGNTTLSASFAIKTYTVTLNAGTGGSVTGGGTYNYGTVVTIVATPSTGYNFTKWSDNNYNASRQITVTSNVSLSASFSIKYFTVSLTAGDGGSVSGSGSYAYGSTVTITATPSTGYNFTKWSDNNTNASRNITVTSNVSLSASFVIKTFTVSTSVSSGQGSVTGGGTYNYGQTATVTATPDTGFNFHHWDDGSTAATKSFTVTANTSLTAYFLVKTYTVTVSVGSGQGSVSGSGTYEHGQTATITATPNTGYRFVQWSDGDTNASRQITVTGNTTLSASFAIKTYTVTLNAGTGGSVTGGGTYNYGTEITIAASPNTNYRFVQWSDGVTARNRLLTVTDNITLSASFAYGPPSNEIWYTSTGGTVMTPSATASSIFGANITSNTYSGGKGIITFDGNVTSVGGNAFRGKTDMATIIFPSTVTGTGNYSFFGCSNCTSVTFLSTTPPSYGGAQMFVSTTFTIFVPSSSVSAYKSATGWSSYASRIVAIGSALKYRITDDCINCEVCLESCNQNAISFSSLLDRYTINPNLCNGCGACYNNPNKPLDTCIESYYG